MNRATIIAGAGGGLLIVALLAPATGTALGTLARARADRAAVTALADAPVEVAPPLLARELRVSEGGAAKAMAARIRGLAARSGVLVEQVEPVASAAGVARLRVRLSGSDKALVALADQLEREAPLLRFASWQMTGLANDEVRLEGEVMSAWR